MPSPPSQSRSSDPAADATGASGTDHGTRLSPLDGSFLRLDSPRSPMHVGFSAVFAAPSGGYRPSVEALRERAAGRLHEVPWCRWRLDRAPLGLSEPRWVDDAQFDLGAHIVALTRPEDPVSYAGFEALRSEVLSAPLDRSRPLWQISPDPPARGRARGDGGQDPSRAGRWARRAADRQPNSRSRARRGITGCGPVAATGAFRARRLGAGRGPADGRRRRRRAACRRERGHAPAGDRGERRRWGQARPGCGGRGSALTRRRPAR